MAVSPIPETSQSPDWPRKVARKVNTMESRLTAMESGGGPASGSFLFDDGTASSGGSFSLDDGGA